MIIKPRNKKITHGYVSKRVLTLSHTRAGVAADKDSYNIFLNTHENSHLNMRIAYCRVNVGCGPAEERVLLTGLHAVADIYCECCKTMLGWKYVSIKQKLRLLY